MIKLKNLCVDLGEFLLEEVNLEVRSGEYFIILGPTGAGKTVLLETLAGLYPAKSGEVWIAGREVTSLEPEKRDLGFVYQDYMLFPHLSARENIAFGLKLRGKSAKEIEAVIVELTELLGISHLLERRPETLSGGERQKIALARALAIRPKVLLLDEPLSALDPETKERLQRELRRVHDQLGLTTIHVTHDFEEAMALGDRVAVLSRGRIVQVGTPAEIFRHPNSEFVAQFALTRNIFSGEVVEGREGPVFITEGTALAVVTELRGKLHASLRPEDILISQEPLLSSARNRLKGKVVHIADRGSTLYLTVRVPPDFTCLVTRYSFEEMNLKEGDDVYLTFKASAVHIF